jgi:hypothetical protein
MGLEGLQPKAAKSHKQLRTAEWLAYNPACGEAVIGAPVFFLPAAGAAGLVFIE